jgi:imidazolonepropionase-like amidohydrolase/ABC-type multidrug transport system permease subunit
MKPYLALTRINLRLAMREKAVLFFNYVFPLIFFFGFASAFGRQSGMITQVVSMVLVIGLLGSGLFGAGMRAVAEREANILRRYKVAPISPAPILVASMVTGWILYMPSVLLIFGIAHFRYYMELPQHLLSLFALVTVGSFAMRAIGLIVASVVNSVAESNILIQVLYMPMLFLSGATFPLTAMPNIAQIIAQYLPASHLFSGMQGIMLRNESLSGNLVPTTALLISTIVGTFVSMKLFRWEKEEKIARSAKAWILVVLAPFLVLGTWQAHTKENLAKNKVYERQLRRNHSWLIRNARIFTGDRVIESGSVLLKDGRIAEIYEGSAPDAKALNADSIEASGKTLLPGLIDVHVHLGAPGVIPESDKDYDPKKNLDRALEAYLYSGVTAVRSTGDFLDEILKARERFAEGQKLGAELFLCGPLFTAEGGHGTEYFANAPAFVKQMSAEQFVRLPKTPDEAKRQVDALKARGVDAIKAVLEAGAGAVLFNRLDLALLNAIAQQAHADGLPITVHTGEARDVKDAVAAHVNGIEHGSARDRIPDETFALMVKQGIAYDPTLSVMEAFQDLKEGKMDLLDRSLVAQVVPPKVLQNTKQKLASSEGQKGLAKLKEYPVDLTIAEDNLLRAYRAGVLVVVGSDSGNMMVVHGPAVHREMQLWVKAGIPAEAALAGATANAAKALRVDNRLGYIRKGYDATLLLVDGNPLQDISATEHISGVFFKGESVNRSGLFDQQ